MNRSFLLALSLVGSVSIAACGSSSGGTGSSGTTGAASSSGAGGASTTASSSSSTTTSSTSGGGAGGASGTGGGGMGGGAMGPKPAAPTILMVMKMMGALHVMWDNNEPSCDKIHMLRDHDNGAFAEVYALSGAATEKHDAAAIPPGSYCFKLVCEKGGVMSDDSNKKCGTP